MSIKIRRAWGRDVLLLAVLWLAGMAMVVPPPEVARAAPNVRLIMVDAPNCIYCRKWDAEIGKIYPKSDEGRFAPLKRVQRDADALKDFAPAIFTPTFIVVRGTEEVGRITGYPGHIFFWDELYPILVAAGYPPSNALNKP